MKTDLLTILAVAVATHGIAVAQAQVKPSGAATLAFTASGTNEFTFDTGVLQGKLRAGGKSKGLSSVVHRPTGMTVDSSMGLFGHYRVFSANKRYGTAAWDWPSEAKLRPDGSVEVHWPSAEDRPFELRAVYRWTAPDTLDLETSVQAKTNLPKFESFLASYFSPGFTNAFVYARTNGHSAAHEAADQDLSPFGRPSRATTRPRPSFRMDAGPSRPARWIGSSGPALPSPLGVRRCPATATCTP